MSDIPEKSNNIKNGKKILWLQQQNITILSSKKSFTEVNIAIITSHSCLVCPRNVGANGMKEMVTS